VRSRPLPPVDLLAGLVPPEQPQIEIPESVRSYLANRPAPTAEASHGSASHGSADLDAALAADREREGAGVLGSNLSRAAALIRGEQVGGPSLPRADERTKAYALRQQMQEHADTKAWQRGEPERALKLFEAKASLDAASDAKKAAEAARVRGEERADERTWREGESAKDREIRREALAATAAARGEAASSRELLNEDRKARASDRAENQNAKHWIGEDFSPTSRPLPPPVQADLQKRIAATRVVDDNAATLEKLLSEGGPAVVGQRAALMEQLANNIWTELKDIKGLGVLAGPDMGILQGILADPTKMRTVLKDTARINSFVGLVQTFRQRMKADTVQRAGTYGATPVEGGLFFVAPPAAAAPRTFTGAAADAPPAPGPKVVERRRTADGRILVKYEDGRVAEEGR
jgi:hypothetical protein